LGRVANFINAELPLNGLLENLIARQLTILKVGTNVEPALAPLDETAAVLQLEIIGRKFSSILFGLTADKFKLTTQFLLGRNAEAPHKLFTEGLRAYDVLFGDVSAINANVVASNFEVLIFLNIGNFKLNVRSVHVLDFAGRTFNFVAQSKSLGDSRSFFGASAFINQSLQHGARHIISFCTLSVIHFLPVVFY
jgi:hypothetical protein